MMIHHRVDVRRWRKQYFQKALQRKRSSTLQVFSRSVLFLIPSLLWLLGSGCTHVSELSALPPSVTVQDAGSSIIWAHAGRTNKDLILLVHGWDGDKIQTWSSLSQLLLTDERLAQFDVATFGYLTGCFGPYPGVDEVAYDLAAFVDRTLQGYDRIHIISHSLGGLVARRYIVDVLKEGGKGALKVEHLLMLGTPNEGARWYIGFLGTLFCGKQASQARPTSAFISDLGAGWIKYVQNGGRPDLPEASRKSIPTFSIVASDDVLVGNQSASSYFKDDMVKTSHTGIKEVQTHTDHTYLLFTDWLRSKSFTETSVSDWKLDNTLWEYLRNWRESVRFQPDAILKTHASTTRWTYVFSGQEVYVILEKSGHHLASRGAAQSQLKSGLSYDRCVAYDNLRQRPITSRSTPVDGKELPYHEVDIGESFDMLFTCRAAHGAPFCRAGDPYGIIIAMNNAETVEGYEVAIYAESAPTNVRAYWVDDAYKPWFVSSGDTDEAFVRLKALQPVLAQVDADLARTIDVSRLRYGRVFHLPVWDVPDTFLLKFSCDIFPAR